MEAELIMKASEISNRDAWLQQRKAGIGGSDASCIVGRNKWKNMYTLWAEKKGYIDPEDKSDVEAVHFGAVQEQVVADEFTLRTGKKVKKCGLYRSIKHPFMLASIDRLVVGENAGLECKTAASWFSDDWEGDNIPDAYLVQCLHYMAVCGFDRYYIACLIGGNHYVWKTIERADVQEEIDALIKAEEKFWAEYIVGEKMPELDDTNACTVSLNKRYKDLSAQTMQLDSETDDLCRSIKQLEEEVLLIKKQVDLKKNKLRDILGDCPKGESYEYNVSYKFQAGPGSFDKEKFKQEHPEIDIDYYWKKSQSRVLRISKQKQKKI